MLEKQIVANVESCRDSLAIERYLKLVVYKWFRHGQQLPPIFYHSSTT